MWASTIGSCRASYNDTLVSGMTSHPAVVDLADGLRRTFHPMIITTTLGCNDAVAEALVLPHDIVGAGCARAFS